jgi:hypothetical protein
LLSPLRITRDPVTVTEVSGASSVWADAVLQSVSMLTPHISMCCGFFILSPGW